MISLRAGHLDAVASKQPLPKMSCYLRTGEVSESPTTKENALTAYMPLSP